MRLRVDPARRLLDQGGYDFGTWGVLPEETYDLSDTRLAVDGQPLDEDRRVVHLRRDRAAVSAAAERRVPLHRFAGGGAEPVPVSAVVRAGARSAR